MQAYIADVKREQLDFIDRYGIVVYFAGCDFRCPFCFSKPLLDFKEEYRVSVRDINNQIKQYALHNDTIFFTGGEPCLQRPALLELAKLSKSLKLKTGLATNASNPLVVKQLLEKELLDYISIDIKSPLNESHFEKITKSQTFFKPSKEIIENINQTLSIVKKHHNITLDIRTTIVPGLIYTKEDIMQIAHHIHDIPCVWIFQQFQNNQGHIASKMFTGLQPPTNRLMQHIKDHVLKTYPNLTIKIKTDNYTSIPQEVVEFSS